MKEKETHTKKKILKNSRGGQLSLSRGQPDLKKNTVTAGIFAFHQEKLEKLKDVSGRYIVESKAVVTTSSRSTLLYPKMDGGYGWQWRGIR
uniref:Uncharacterized protein n=1 Tax=Romanomermis culicivorax TaxID=13658 RepID=A0A915K1L2_ROMCU